MVNRCHTCFHSRRSSVVQKCLKPKRHFRGTSCLVYSLQYVLLDSLGSILARKYCYSSSTNTQGVPYSHLPHARSPNVGNVTGVYRRIWQSFAVRWVLWIGRLYSWEKCDWMIRNHSEGDQRSCRWVVKYLRVLYRKRRKFHYLTVCLGVRRSDVGF